MSKAKRKPNKSNEFLLDVTPINDGKQFCIYDISLYLPHWEGWDRKKYMDRVSHTIKGKQFTIHIIDYYESLDNLQAIKLAGAWFNGNTTYHRLD